MLATARSNVGHGQPALSLPVVLRNVPFTIELFYSAGGVWPSAAYGGMPSGSHQGQPGPHPHVGSTLSVVLTDAETHDLWVGEFTDEYIEDVTRKTGSLKRFAVFVEMLSSALRNSNDSVSLDLLSPEDLQSLNSRKSQYAHQLSDAGDRRYLILAHASAFDRVHYPLPLNRKPCDTARLRELIRDLRRSCEMHVSELNKVVAENDRLRTEISRDDSKSQVQQLLYSLQAAEESAAQAKEALELLHSRAEEEICALREDYASFVQQSKQKNRDSSSKQALAETKRLKTEISRLTSELEKERRRTKEDSAELIRLRKRVAEAESSLAQSTRGRSPSVRKAPYSGVRDRSSSATRTAPSPQRKTLSRNSSRSSLDGPSRVPIANQPPRRSSLTRNESPSYASARQPAPGWPSSSLGNRAASRSPSGSAPKSAVPWGSGPARARQSSQDSLTREPLRQRNASPRGAATGQRAGSKDLAYSAAPVKPSAAPARPGISKSSPRFGAGEPPEAMDIEARLNALQDFLERARSGDAH